MRNIILTCGWFAAAITLTVIGLCLLFAVGLCSQWVILFYRGLFLVGVSSAVTLVLLLMVCRIAPRWQARDAISAALLSAGLTVCFLVVVPVTVDRSISVFMLNQMAAYPDELFSPQDVEAAFITRYVGEYQEIARRLEEQRASGNVRREGDHYRITAQGIAFMRVARAISAIFGTDPRLVSRGQATPIGSFPEGHPAGEVQQKASGG
jgi:hypothetical protein